MARKPKPMEATLEVSNPHYLPGHPDNISTVVVRRALRDDPLGRLHARGQIKEAQYRAGRRWQELYEAAAVGGSIRSIDTTNEPVDGTKRHPEPITERMQKAMREIMRLDGVLGQEGGSIVRGILADRMTTRQMAINRGFGNEDYYGKRFRECLNTLARELGYRT